jgi:hypothetical protein
MQRDLLYVALFGLGLLAAGSGRHAALVGRVVLAVIVGIVGAGLIHGSGGRLSYPLTYWNAFGALAAVGVALAAGMGSDPRAPVAVRALCGAAVVPLADAVYLSLSRGTWLALIVGAVVLLALGARRGSLLLTVAVSGAAATLVILGAPLLPLTAAAGAAIAVIAAGRASPLLMQALRRVVRPLLIMLAVVAALVAFAAYVAKAEAVEGRTDRALRSAGDFSRASGRTSCARRPASGRTAPA